MIDEHREGKGLDILTQASQALEAPKLSKNQRYKQNLKNRKTAQTDDIQTIVATLLTLLVSAWAVPSDLKPNEEEVNSFSVPATRMLLRHVPIASKLSQDALDMIGMIGALSSYYVRTGDGWRAYRLTREAQRDREQEAIPPGHSYDDPLDALLIHRQVDNNAEV